MTDWRHLADDDSSPAKAVMACPCGKPHDVAFTDDVIRLDFICDCERRLDPVSVVAANVVAARRLAQAEARQLGHAFAFALVAIASAFENGSHPKRAIETVKRILDATALQFENGPAQAMLMALSPSEPEIQRSANE